MFLWRIIQNDPLIIIKYPPYVFFCYKFANLYKKKKQQKKNINSVIVFQCVFLLDPNYPSYVKGEKQYGFNFIEVLMEMKEEG